MTTEQINSICDVAAAFVFMVVWLLMIIFDHGFVGLFFAGASAVCAGIIADSFIRAFWKK